MRKIWIIALAVVIGIVGLLVWQSRHDYSDPIVAGKSPVPVRFQLQWTDQAQFAGFFAAKKKEYYKAEGLDVTLLEGGFQKNPIAVVTNGQADLAIATGDQVLLAAQTADIRALGTVYEHSLLRLLSKRRLGVISPEQLRGHSIAYFPGYDSENIVRALLRQSRLDTTSVQLEPAGATSLQRFRQDRLDVYPAYAINEPLEFPPDSISLLDPSEFGVHFLSDTYLTGGDFLRDHHDVVVRFLRASRKGWEYAAQHPDSAVEMMYAERGRQLTGPERKAQIDQLRAAVMRLNRGAVGRPYFGINTEDWDRMRSALEGIGKSVSRRTENIVDVSAVNEAAQ